MIVEYGAQGFSEEWLALLSQDPVHPGIPIEKRISGTRTVVAKLADGVPQAMICIKFGDKLPQNMEFILQDEDDMDEDAGAIGNLGYRYVVFYSIFKLKAASIKGAGADAIKETKEYFHQKGMKRFFTLSPIPNLTKDFASIPKESAIKRYLNAGTNAVAKFHLGNGAKIHAIHFNADPSEQRLQESWGIMVNYDYCDYV